MGTGSPVAAAFERARSERRAALVGYLPAGYPTVDGAVVALQAMIDAGVDVVEVGLPYSDPLMDGPTIQQAVGAALRAGTTTADVLRTVEAVASAGTPALVMSYWNPIARYGTHRFARDLAAAGGSGVVTPDLIPDEADDWLPPARDHRLDTVFLVAPSSTDERIALTVEACRGFVYAASTMGVTGARAQRGHAAAALVAAHAHGHRPAGRRRARSLDGRPGRRGRRLRRRRHRRLGVRAVPARRRRRGFGRLEPPPQWRPNSPAACGGVEPLGRKPSCTDETRSR